MNKIPKKYMVLVALVTELVTLEIALVYAGQYLDTNYGWAPYGVIGGAFLGFSVWVFHLVLALKNLTGDENQ